MLDFLKTNRVTLVSLLACTFYAFAFNASSGWTLFFGMFILVTLACFFALQLTKLIPINKEVEGHYQEGIPFEAQILKNQIGKFQGELTVGKHRGKLISYEQKNLNTIQFIFENTFKRGNHGTVKLNIYASDPLYILKISRLNIDIHLNIYPSYYHNVLQDINEILYNFETLHSYQNGDTNFEIKDLVEYKAGMSMKSIHWKASSKRDVMISKVLDKETKDKLSIAFYNADHFNYESALGVFYTLISSSKAYQFSKAWLDGENVLDKGSLAAFLNVNPSPEPGFDFKGYDVIVTPVRLENLGTQQLQLCINKGHLMCYQGTKLHAKIPLSKGDASYE